MFLRSNFYNKMIRHLILSVFVVCTIVVPNAAFARWEIVDRLDLSPFIPRVLDAFMIVARGTYEYFVGNGDGIIYVMIWGFLAVSLFMYAALMYFPKRWIEFVGLSGGGEMWDGKVSAFGMGQRVLQTLMRAIIAASILLQIRPTLITNWLINPFLEFGAIYTHSILDMANTINVAKPVVSCPPGILSGDWLSVRSCEFLMQPVSDLSAVNNSVVKRGFEFLASGFRGLVNPFVHGIGTRLTDIVTGVLLIFTFVGCNLFMALLIIQGIFNFGMSLILYPFKVLTWVAKPSDKWFDIWPPFSDIIKALQQLVVTMIACAFILIINIAVVRALFNWNSSIFVVAAGGTASSNLPAAALSTNAIGFGGHSLLWLSSLLTFFLMNAIFNATRKQLELYAPGMTDMYNQVKNDFNASRKKARGIFDSVKKIIGLIK